MCIGSWEIRLFSRGLASFMNWVVEALNCFYLHLNSTGILRGALWSTG